MKVEDGSDEAAGADSCTAFEDHTLRSPLGHNPEPESRTCLVMPTLSTPPPSLMFRVPQEVVRVQVMNHDFLVHKQVLVKDSPYFERALNGPFAESKRQEIVLNEVSPGDFGFYVDILYRSFFVPKFILRKEQTGGRLSTKQILSFWQLSDRFLNGPLVDMAKESLDHRLSLYSPPHWIKLYQRCDKADIEERMSRLQDAFNQCLNGGMPFKDDIVRAAANCPPQVYRDCLHIMETEFMGPVSQLLIMGHADPNLVRKNKPADEKQPADEMVGITTV